MADSEINAEEIIFGGILVMLMVVESILNRTLERKDFMDVEFRVLRPMLEGKE